ncbi:MAG TPA: porphobilinogen synthase [Nitrososphaerales archaeon]|nr:porphobilinogen synthase [Nitrososphaerales archaeon]
MTQISENLSIVSSMTGAMHRPRRLRLSDGIRSLVSENEITPEHLVMPIFVKEGSGIKEEIDSMPGIFRYSPDKSLDQEVNEINDLGIRAVLLFGIPGKKDAFGSESYNRNGVVQSAVRRIKETFPEMVVICDVCMCEYTDHGHCGLLNEQGQVENDKTTDVLGKIAVSQARAGADIVAPSAMMDNQVISIRNALDSSGFANIPIMSYSSKYSSAFYGPFREAASSAPSFGDRKSYQMNSANVREAIRETRLDIEQGADIVMVKPALPYLDVIRAIREKFDLPLAAYSVSGEYSMIKAAALKGWIREEQAVSEALTSIKRAGADIIITYFAKQFVKFRNSKGVGKQ